MVGVSGRWVFLFLLFLLLLPGCFRGEKEAYFRGDKALSQGRFQLAYRSFLGVAKKGGDSEWAARSLLKLAQMERVVYQRPQKALDYCQTLVKGSFPERYRREALFLMADIRAQDLNDPQGGLEILEGTSFSSPDPRKEKLMVEYAIRAGDMKKAVALAREFLKEREGLENLRFALVLADLFKSAGAWKKAEELYSRVITQGKGDLAHEALLAMAGLREDQKRLRDALTILKDLQKEGYKPHLMEVKMKHIRRRLREERG